MDYSYRERLRLLKKLPDLFWENMDYRYRESKKNFKMGILGVASGIENFRWDERKFLNGLTEQEFSLRLRNHKAISDARQERLDEIIKSLREQEKDSKKNPAYQGRVEDVTFHITTGIVEYDSGAERIACHKIHRPYRASYSLETTLLCLNRGNKVIMAPNLHPGLLKEQVLLKDVSQMSPLDSRLHEALFKSVDHDYSVRPPMTSAAYHLAVLAHGLPRKARYRREETFAVEHQVNGEKQIGISHHGTLTFAIDARIQYRFIPLLGGFEILQEKFGLRDYLVVASQPKLPKKVAKLRV